MAQKRQKTNHQRYNGANEYYNYTSVAYDTPPIYQNTPSDDKKKLKEIEKRRAELEKSRMNHSYTVKTVFAMIFLVSGCLSIMGAHAMLSKQRITLGQYKEQLAELKNENAILSAEVAEQTDLDKIKETAINKLGMSEPQSYQVVYIDVPKQSYTLEFGAEKPQEKTGDIMSKISKVLKRD